MKDSFQENLVRSRLIWAGYVERMGNKKLAKRTDAQKVKGKGTEEDRIFDGGLH